MLSSSKKLILHATHPHAELRTSKLLLITLINNKLRLGGASLHGNIHQILESRFLKPSQPHTYFKQC